VAVLSVACIVVGNDFPRAAPDRQAEQDPCGVLSKAAAEQDPCGVMNKAAAIVQDPCGVLNKAAAIVEKKLDPFAVYITPAASPLYSPQLQHSRHDDTTRAPRYVQIGCVFVIPPSRAAYVLQL
jgi:hypothetical protein